MSAPFHVAVFGRQLDDEAEAARLERTLGPCPLDGLSTVDFVKQMRAMAIRHLGYTEEE